MRVTDAEGYIEPRDSISHDWLHKLAGWDMTPLPIPNMGNDAISYLKNLKPDLLILSGGDDIGTTLIRDETEHALLNHALTSDLPVLGVCRGLQLINTILGGTLGTISGHVAKPHELKISSEWHTYYSTNTIVNSFHNYCVEPGALAADLRATAFDSANNIEGFCHREKPLAAIMWHPERPDAPLGDLKLIHSLIAKGKEF